jgi:hypothetical protein
MSKFTPEQQIFQAIRDSDFWEFYTLLNMIPDPLVRDPADWTLLHETLACGEGAMTIILLERGIPPQIKTKDGLIPYACGDAAGHHGLKHALFLFSEHKDEYYTKVRTEIVALKKGAGEKRRLGEALERELNRGEERRAKEARQRQALRTGRSKQRTHS